MWRAFFIALHCWMSVRSSRILCRLWSLKALTCSGNGITEPNASACNTLCFPHIHCGYGIRRRFAENFFYSRTISRQLISIIICILCVWFCILLHVAYSLFKSGNIFLYWFLRWATNPSEPIDWRNDLSNANERKNAKCQLKIFHQVVWVCAVESYRCGNDKFTVPVDKHRSYLVYMCYHHTTVSNHIETYQSNTLITFFFSYAIFFFTNILCGLFGAALAHLDRTIHARCLTDSINHLTQ